MKAIDELRALMEAATPKWCSGDLEHGRLFASLHGSEIANFHETWDHRMEENATLALQAVNALPLLLTVAEAAENLMPFCWEVGMDKDPESDYERELVALRAALAALERAS